MPEHTIALVMAGAVSLLVIGWVLAPATGGANSARRYLGTHRLALGSILAVLAGNTLLSLPLLEAVREEGGRLNQGTFLWALLATQIPMVLLIYVRVVAPGAYSWGEMGLRLVGPWTLLRWGIGMGFTALLLSAAIGLILQQLGLSHNQLEEFAFVLDAEPLEFGFILFGGAVMAPLVEELFFRGYLFGLYRQRKPLWVAYLASATLFALVHLFPVLTEPVRALGLLIAIIPLGLLLAWVYQRTGSLLPGMVAHGVNNSLALIALYVSGGVV